MHSITIASEFLKQALAGAIESGYDTNKLLQQCGIAPKILEHSKSRVTLTQFTQVVRKLIFLMNDEAVGLLERPVRSGHLKIMGYSVITAETIGESWQRAIDYHNLFENSFSSELQNNGTQVTYVVHRNANHRIKNSLIIEQWLMTMHRFHAWMANERLPIEEIKLDYPAPSYKDEYRFMFYSAHIKFNQPVNSITLKSSLFNLPNKQTIRSLETFIEQAPFELFSPLNSSSLSNQVRIWVEQQLRIKEATPTIDDASQAFNMLPQTFRRKLKQDESSYTELKVQARRDVAIDMINNSKESIESIAFKTGFSESSAFIRAFRSWTGMSPLSYRKTLQIH